MSWDDVCNVCVELASVSRAAWDTLTTAMFTCSTAVVCCFVLSSISFAACDVVTTRPGDLRERGGHFAEAPGAGVDRLRPALGRHDRGVHRRPNVVDEAAYLFRRAPDAVRELADLVGHDPEAAADLSRAGGLDGGVDGEDVRLLRELVDDLEDAADLL